ncbi:MAG: lysylphosphatidylglycerol synthase domain-containing protein, partial [Pseudomonadota bacterium]
AIATRLAAGLQRIPIARFRRWLSESQRGFAQIDRETRGFFALPRRRRAPAFLAFLCEWLVEGIETLLIVRLLHLPLTVGPALTVDALGSLLRVIVFFLPAGLGVQDAAIILLFGKLGVANAVAAGTALVLIKRTKELFWIAAGTLFLLVRGDLRRSQTEAQPAPSD